MKTIRFAVTFLFLIPLALVPQQPSSPCKVYEPASVALKGKIVRKTFPGPPGYDSTRKGDKAETFWMIELEEPVCVLEDPSQPDLNPALRDVKTIQLVLDRDGYKRFPSMLGRNVLVTGTLSAFVTGHHHARLLLRVSNLKLAQN